MKRVMIVDDEADLLELQKDFLSEEGFESFCFASAEEALRAVEQLAPDVIVADLRLPEMDGFAMLREIRGRGIRTPVLIQTGLLNQSELPEIRDLAVNKVLEKPFNTRQLLEALKEICDD